MKTWSTFESFLKRMCFCLVDKRYLLDLVTFILKEERACIRLEIADNPVSVIFYGTSHLREVMVVMLPSSMIGKSYRAWFMSNYGKKHDW